MENTEQQITPKNTHASFQSPSEHTAPPRKKFPLIPILLGAFLFLLLGCGGYVLFAKKTRPIGKAIAQVSPTAFQPSPKTDPTANWKIYRNSKYGYILKYPSNFFVEESHDPMGDIDTTEISNIETKKFNSGVKDPDDSDVFLMFITNPWQGNRTLEDAYRDYPLSRSTYTVGEESGFIANGKKTVVVNKNGKEYVFNIRSLNTQSKLFDQILSTFKFTDQTTNPTAPPGCYYKVCNYMCPKNQPNCCDNVTSELICPSTTPSSYSCPATETLSCKPTGDVVSEMCVGDYLAWIQKNCPEVTITR
jgi:hypothetical protein